MITVITRPLGHKLTDAELDATVTSDSGTALFNTLFAHGLQDGDYVFVQSNIEAYNGYKYVDSFSYNSFRLRESESGAFVEFKQQADVFYRVSVLQHGYIAISQPIVYELQSDLWPINQVEEAYIPIVVASSQDAEGYTQINLSVGMANIEELDFIEIVGTGPLAGPYQVTTKLQPWSFIINLAYDAGNSFSGYQVVKYYNNYCINVNVYSGLGVEHPWYAEKPYELASTLRFTPDANGKAKFSISDILKGFIETRNNLTLNTLPNNLDFMTAFYIEYFESYDVSDGDEISTFEGFLFSDSFEGHAINADMPFKSLYISHMSEFLNEDVYLAKWLVLQSNPVVVIGYYFDLSFLNQAEGADILIFGNGELILTISNPGVGVIRVPIEPVTTGQLCIEAHTSSREEEVPPEALDLSLMENGTGGAAEWVLGSMPYVYPSPGTETLWVAKITLNGATLKVNYRLTVSVGIVVVSFAVSSSTNSLGVDKQNTGVLGVGVYETSINLTATADRAYLVVYVEGAGATLVLNAISFGDPSTVTVPGETVTEEICLTVLEECDNTFISDDDIRLTEDGDFRILE